MNEYMKCSLKRHKNDYMIIWNKQISSLDTLGTLSTFSISENSLP